MQGYIRTAGQDRHYPSDRQRGTTVGGTQQTHRQWPRWYRCRRPGRRFRSAPVRPRAGGQVKECVLQGDQHPAHLVLKIHRGNAGGGLAQSGADRERPQGRTHPRSAARLPSCRGGSPPQDAAEMAAAKQAQAARQTGCGWDSEKSSLAKRRRLVGTACPDADGCDAHQRTVALAAAVGAVRGGLRLVRHDGRSGGKRQAGGMAAVERCAGIPPSVGGGSVFRVVAAASAPDCGPRSGPIRCHPSVGPPTYAIPGWQRDRARHRDERRGSCRRSGIPPVIPGCRRSPSPACSPMPGRSAGPPPPAARSASPWRRASVQCCRAMSATAVPPPPPERRRNRQRGGCPHARRR